MKLKQLSCHIGAIEDRRFIHCIGASQEFCGTEIDDALIRGSRVLYLGGYGLSESLSPANVAALFARARAAGVTTVLDVVLTGPSAEPTSK